MTSEDIAMKIQQATCEATHMAILAGTMKTHDSAAATHIGCMSMLGAMQPTAMIVARKPTLSTSEIKEKGEAVAMGLLTTETLVFTAILAALTQQEAAPNGNISVEFGPHIIFQALEMAEKVFGKSIDHLLDERMVEAARQCGAGSNLPLEQLMAKRSTAHSASKTLQ